MEYFHYVPSFPVLICKTCKYGVLPSQNDTHFANKKVHGLSKKERERVICEVGKIDGLIRDEDALRVCEFPFPPPTARPIAALGRAKTNGLRCTFEVESGVGDQQRCRYVCCTERRMRQHCWDSHRWKSQRKGGRPRKDGQENSCDNVPWQAGVHCQRFFQRGPKSGYFEVERIESSPGQGTRAIASRRDQFEAVKQQTARASQKARERETRRSTAGDPARGPNPWVERTGWSTHLGGLDKKRLVKLIASPSDDEAELQLLCTAFSGLISDAQDHAVRGVVGLEALFEVNKTEVAKRPTKPFESRMDSTTVTSYVRVWSQVLCYIWRAEKEEASQRPRYQLTEQQRQAMGALAAHMAGLLAWKAGGPPGGGSVEGAGWADEEGRRMGRLQRSVLQWCLALLDHALQDDEYESALISGLAVLGIRADFGWLAANDYTPKYAAVIKLARLMVVQEAYLRRREQIRGYRQAGMTEGDAMRKATSHVGRVRQLVDRVTSMAHDGREATPMHFVYHTLAYGLKIVYTSTAGGRIQWRGEEVLYPGTRFTMAQLREMVHGLVKEARSELFQELMMAGGVGAGGGGGASAGGGAVPPIDWAQVVDQPSEAQVGWSFLDDERNAFHAHKDWWLLERMYLEPRLRARFLDGAGEVKRAAVEAYRRRVERFLELLLVLMHLCGGQPSRAPEILGIRWKNTVEEGARNIVVEDGLVAFVTQYHKGYRSSGRLKIIHRYLPVEVGSLLVYYLWLVVPFWQTLQHQCTAVWESGAFLWRDGATTDGGGDGAAQGGGGDGAVQGGGGDGAAQENGERRRADQETGDSRQRHAEIDRGEAGDAETMPLEGQRRREQPQAKGSERRLASAAWTSERMRKVLQEVSVRWMGPEARLNISGWRQIAIAISRRFCREHPFERPQGQGAGDDGCDDDDADDDDDIWDLQAGHSTLVAGTVYARELKEAEDAISSRRERFRRVSEAWHRFLGFASARQGSMAGGTKRRGCADEDASDAVEKRRWKRLRAVDIQGELESTVGAGAQFRGLQKAALEAIMQGQSPILVVMGTSVGKTILFQIPALRAGSGTTVVITPLVSLQDHMVLRCQGAGISCVKWDCQQQPQAATQIVMITPESAVSKAFASYLNGLQGQQQLARVVFDEAHTILESTGEFRPQMRRLWELSMRGVQMVFLTATLPPRMEAQLWRVMRLRAQSVRVFRGATTRANIAYSVVEYGADVEETEAVCRLVREKLAQYAAPAKIIVYAGTIARTRELSEALGCHAYYSEVGDREEKQRIMASWQRGEGRLMVATNAFGLGIDAPDVRAVIHSGQIFQMRDYSQESGRGGRDGKRSEAIAVMRAGKQAALRKKHAQGRSQPCRAMNAAEERQEEWEKMEEYLSGARCRRVFMDAEMDGRTDRVRCEDGEERCDVCEKHGGVMDETSGGRQQSDGVVDLASGGRQQSDGVVDLASGGQQQCAQARPLEQSEGVVDLASGGQQQCAQARPSEQSDGGVELASGGQQCAQARPSEQSDGGVDLASGGVGLASGGVDSSIQVRTIPDASSGAEAHIVEEEPAPPCSVVDGMSSAESQCFEQQQRQRAAQLQHIRQQEQRAHHEAGDLESQLDVWVGKCPLCYVRQCQGWSVDVQHALRTCPDQARESVAKQAALLNKISFQPFACCTFCGVAQKICSRWEERCDGRARFRLVAGGTCQYAGIIRAAVAAMCVAAPTAVVDEGLYARMRADAIWERAGSRVATDDAEGSRVMMEWFARKVVWGSMEASVFLQVFYWLAVALQAWKSRR